MSFKAIPTRSVRDTVARTLQLVQKTNSWCSGSYLFQDRDSQGKTRSCFCLAGAIRAAVAGETVAAERSALSNNRHFTAAQKAILKTVNANLVKYGLDETDGPITDVIDFNDAPRVKHRHVIRALRDTMERLETKAAVDAVASNLDYSQSGAGCG